MQAFFVGGNGGPKGAAIHLRLKRILEGSLTFRICDTAHAISGLRRLIWKRPLYSKNWNTLAAETKLLLKDSALNIGKASVTLTNGSANVYTAAAGSTAASDARTDISKISSSADGTLVLDGAGSYVVGSTGTFSGSVSVSGSSAVMDIENDYTVSTKFSVLDDTTVNLTGAKLTTGQLVNTSSVGIKATGTSEIDFAAGTGASATSLGAITNGTSSTTDDPSTLTLKNTDAANLAYIEGLTVTQYSGDTLVLDGSKWASSGTATISAGNLEFASGATVSSTAASTITVSAGNLTNKGTFNASGDVTVTAGDFTNTGTFTLDDKVLTAVNVDLGDNGVTVTNSAAGITFGSASTAGELTGKIVLGNTAAAAALALTNNNAATEDAVSLADLDISAAGATASYSAEVTLSGTGQWTADAASLVALQSGDSALSIINKSTANDTGLIVTDASDVELSTSGGDLVATTSDGILTLQGGSYVLESADSVSGIAGAGTLNLDGTTIKATGLTGTDVLTAFSTLASASHLTSTGSGSILEGEFDAVSWWGASDGSRTSSNAAQLVKAEVLDSDFAGNASTGTLTAVVNTIDADKFGYYSGGTSKTLTRFESDASAVTIYASDVTISGVQLTAADTLTVSGAQADEDEGTNLGTVTFGDNTWFWGSNSDGNNINVAAVSGASVTFGTVASNSHLATVGANSASVHIASGKAVSAAAADFTSGNLIADGSGTSLTTTSAMAINAAKLGVASTSELTLNGGSGSTISGTAADSVGSGGLGNEGQVTLEGYFTLAGNTDLGETLVLGSSTAAGTKLNLTGAGYTLTADSLTVESAGVVLSGAATIGDSGTTMVLSGSITGDGSSSLTLADSAGATAPELGEHIDVGSLALATGKFQATTGTVETAHDFSAKSGATFTISSASVNAGGDISFATGSTLVLGSAGAVNAGGDITLASNVLNTSGEGTINANGSLTVNTQTVSAATVLYNGTGETDLSKLTVTAAGSLTLGTTGTGTFKAGTLTGTAATGVIAGAVTVDGADAATTLTASKVESGTKVTVKGADTALDLSGITSAANLDLTGNSAVTLTSGGIVKLNAVALDLATGTGTSASTISGIGTDSVHGWNSAVADDTQGVYVASTDTGYINISGLTSKSMTADTAAALNTEITSGQAGTVQVNFTDVNWIANANSGASGLSDTLAFSEVNTAGGVTPTADVGTTADTDGTYTVSAAATGDGTEISTLTVAQATGGSAVSTVALAAGTSITLDNKGGEATDGYIQNTSGSDLAVTLAGTGNNAAELAVSNSGVLGSVLSSSGSTAASGATEAQTIAAMTDTGTGSLSVNEGSTGVTPDEISSSAVVTVANIGSITESSGATTYNRVESVSVGKGTLAVTENAVVNNVALGSNATVTAAAFDVTGDIVGTGTEAGNLTTSGALVLDGASGSEQEISGMNVDVGTLAVYDTNTTTTAGSSHGGRTVVVSDNNGVSSVVEADALALNGNTLFIDPAIVKVGSLLVGDSTSSTALDGKIVLGDSSGFYIGAESTSSNLNAYIGLVSGTATVVTTKTVGPQTLVFTNVGYIDQSLVIGTTKYDTDGTTILSTYAPSGINVDGTLSKDLWPTTAFTTWQTDGATDATFTAVPVADADENTVRVQNGGLLVISGALSFANNSPQVTSVVDISAADYQYEILDPDNDGTYETVNRTAGTAGQLLFSGTASVTADSVVLNGGNVYAVSGSTATLTGLGTLNSSGAATAAGISALNTVFTTEAGSVLNLVNEGDTGLTTEAAKLANQAEISGTTNHIAGTVNLDGYFGITDAQFANSGTAGANHSGTVNVLEGSVLTLTDDTADGNGSGLHFFAAFNNYGTVTVGDNTADGGYIGDINAITNASTGVLNLNGGWVGGNAGNKTIVNNGTVNVFNKGGVVTNTTGTDKIYGTFTQSDDGVINVGGTLNNATTAGYLTLTAEKFSFAGNVNVADTRAAVAASTIALTNADDIEYADLTNVTFSNAGDITLSGNFKVLGTQLDSTADAASDGSLIWGATTDTSYGLVNLANGAKVLTDSVDLSEATDNSTLVSAGTWADIYATGTVTLDDRYGIANLGVQGDTVSADELEITAGSVNAVSALKATSVDVLGGSLTLGKDGLTFDAGRAALTAAGGNIFINGSSTTVGALTAGTLAAYSSPVSNTTGAMVGTVTVGRDADITATALTVQTTGSSITFRDNESTITGELTATVTDSTGATGLILDGAELTAQKGLTVAADSIQLKDASVLNLAASDILADDVPASATSSALAEALNEDYTSGAVNSFDIGNEVNITGFGSSTKLTADQYNVLANTIVLGTNKLGIVRTDATYDTTSVEKIVDGKIAYDDIPNSIKNGEFLSSVAVTDIASSDVITGSKHWGSATLESGSSTLNIGTGATSGFLELSAAKAVTSGSGDSATSANVYVAQSSGITPANVVLGTQAGTAYGALQLNGSGELGTVTFNNDDSRLMIAGTDSAQATATIAQLKNDNTASSVIDKGGELELVYADLTVTKGDIKLSEADMSNASLTGAGDITIADMDSAPVVEITAAKSLEVTGNGTSGSAYTAQDGHVTYTANFARGTDDYAIYSSTFTATKKVTVTGARYINISGNTLDAGTDAILTGAQDSSVTWNNVKAGTGATATLAVLGITDNDNDGQVWDTSVTNNTVTASGEGSKAQFGVDDGYIDSVNNDVLASHNISNNTVSGETVEYDIGAGNKVESDTVTAGLKFDVDLGDQTTVKNSTFTANGVNTDSDTYVSTINGELTSGNTVTVAGATLTLDGDLDVLDESTVTARLLNVASGTTLFIDPAYVWAGGVTTSNTSSTANDTIGGNVIVGAGSAFYVGAEDSANNDIADTSALKSYLASSGYGAVAYIESPVTLATGASIIVDNDLTSADDATITANSVTVSSGDALVVTADALGEQDANGNFTEGAISFKTAGSVTLESGSTLEIKDINSFSGEAITVFDNIAATGLANVSSDATILAGNHLFTGSLARTSGDGVVTLSYDDETASEWLKDTDDSIADPIKAYAASSNADQQFKSSSFVNKALNLGSSAEVGKSLNSAARIAVLGGATQNVQLASRSATDAIEERQGFIAKTSSSIGQVQGQDVTVWVTPLYAKQDSDGYDGGKSGDLGVDGKLWGVTLGVDGAMDNGLTIGAAFHVGSGDSDSNGSGYAATDGDFDFWGLSVYGAYSFEGFKVLGDISYTVADNDIDQKNAAGHLDTSMDSKLLTVGLQGKYDFDIDGVTITPHIGLRYHKLDVESYTVNFRGGDSFKGKSFDASYVTIPVGVGISKDILTSGGWTIKPAADFSIIPVAGDKDVTSKIVSNDITMSAKSDISEDVLFRLRLGVDAQYRNFGLGFGYGYLGASDTKSHNLSATLRYTF